MYTVRKPECRCTTDTKSPGIPDTGSGEKFLKSAFRSVVYKCLQWNSLHSQLPKGLLMTIDRTARGHRTHAQLQPPKKDVRMGLDQPVLRDVVIEQWPGCSMNNPTGADFLNHRGNENYYAAIGWGSPKTKKVLLQRRSLQHLHLWVRTQRCGSSCSNIW